MDKQDCHHRNQQKQFMEKMNFMCHVRKQAENKQYQNRHITEENNFRSGYKTIGFECKIWTSLVWTKSRCYHIQQVSWPDEKQTTCSHSL